MSKGALALFAILIAFGVALFMAVTTGPGDRWPVLATRRHRNSPRHADLRRRWHSHRGTTQPVEPADILRPARAAEAR